MVQRPRPTLTKTQSFSGIHQQHQMPRARPRMGTALTRVDELGAGRPMVQQQVPRRPVPLRRSASSVSESQYIGGRSMPPLQQQQQR